MILFAKSTTKISVHTARLYEIGVEKRDILSRQFQNERIALSIHQPRLVFNGEFDPGSGRTLAACLIHASRAGLIRSLLLISLAADG